MSSRSIKMLGIELHKAYPYLSGSFTEGSDSRGQAAYSQARKKREHSPCLNRNIYLTPKKNYCVACLVFKLRGTVSFLVSLSVSKRNSLRTKFDSWCIQSLFFFFLVLKFDSQYSHAFPIRTRWPWNNAFPFASWGLWIACCCQDRYRESFWSHWVESALTDREISWLWWESDLLVIEMSVYRLLFNSRKWSGCLDEFSKPTRVICQGDPSRFIHMCACLKTGSGNFCWMLIWILGYQGVLLISQSRKLVFPAANLGSFR